MASIKRQQLANPRKDLTPVQVQVISYPENRDLGTTPCPLDDRIRFVMPDGYVVYPFGKHIAQCQDTGRYLCRLQKACTNVVVCNRKRSWAYVENASFGGNVYSSLSDALEEYPGLVEHESNV